MKWLIIVSPVSGKRQGVMVVQDQLSPELKRHGVDFQIVLTERAGHAVELGEQGAKQGMGLVAVGGDGTINEVIQGIQRAGKLGETPIGILSQGTMNFYGVCAGLPLMVNELAGYMSRGETRASSLMRVMDGLNNHLTSFEAVHLGPMSHRVCKGASDWRMTLGPMFGIFLNLILGNAFPKSNHHVGTLTMIPSDGGSPVVKTDKFFWVIVTHRNPWNGAVGTDMWVSWMTLDTFPGFGRMMEFFEPQMEHFTGTSRCFGNHARVSRVEFELDVANDQRKNIGLVLDGDAVPAGTRVVIENVPRGINVVASKEFPIAPNPKKQTSKSVTRNAAAWLQMYPPPKGVPFPAPKQVKEEAEEGGGKNHRMMIVLGIALLVWYWRHRR